MKRFRNTWIVFLVLSAVVALGWTAACTSPPSELPNIVFIFADDLGFGDVSCYNSESAFQTPNLDRLAAEGIRFTDAHSPATVCTPSRYSLMTGRMAFRTGQRSRVFEGPGGPSLIEDTRLTLGGMLQSKGYTTAIYGKWHIGLTWVDSSGERIKGQNVAAAQQIDYELSTPLPDGPINRGFDYAFVTPNCPTTDPLYVYIDQDDVPVPATGLLDKSTLPDHPFAWDNDRGMVAPGYEFERADLLFLEKSLQFMRNHRDTTPGKPFFLVLSTQSAHAPSFPAPEYQGSTEAGPHGDFIFELDAIVGIVMDSLAELGIADNTLVMFSSDNGPETVETCLMRELYAHDPARPWRGMKRDGWEGGHRVPFIAHWPGKIGAGRISSQTTTLTDVMATVAAVIGFSLPDDAAEDSYNMLPVLLGTWEEDIPVRPYTLTQSFRGELQIRRGPWKYLDHKGSGGNRYEGRPRMEQYALPEMEPEAPGQLYNLDTDPGETTNLYFKHTEIVEELKQLLEKTRASGRSAPPRK
jgi:arylsulfatase A